MKLKRERVWVVCKSKSSDRFRALYEIQMYLKDQFRPEEPGSWTMEKRRAAFWHTKSDADSVAFMVAVRYPHYIGRLKVTHRVRLTHE